MSEVRPVWLTWGQHDALMRIYELQPPDVIRQILVAWDEAPTDAVEAVTSVLDDVYGNDYIEATKAARAGVLRALGYPEERDDA